MPPRPAAPAEAGGPVQAPITPADVARWAFWGPFRNALDPHRPGQVRALHRGWRLQHLAARGGRRLMEDEFRRCFGNRYDDLGYKLLVKEAYRCAWRVHLEELLLGKVGPDTVENFIVFEGRDNLDKALEHGRGVVWTYPHAGAVMMMLAWLAHHGYPYVQYAARGLPPPEIAAANPQLMATNKLREQVRRVREDNEDRVPCTFLTMDHPTRELYRRLAANELVGIAFDGRAARKFFVHPLLGRDAVLSTGPYRLATSRKAAVVPAFCHTPADGPAVCVVGEPIIPGKDWREVAEEVLRVQQRWLNRWPAEYGIWMLHCRRRAQLDDHPLFGDTADNRDWERWRG
ncbi:MAG: hypothetical protein D6798_05450 [Deltaproteobacteria bacterium]|nr:MAG: hypothetical protein D6798_05450 [Deltaproteobacteria bacterium]